MPSIILSAGLLLFYVGERVVDAGPARWALLALGALLVVAATGWRFSLSGATEPGRVHRTLARLHLLTIAALVLYALQSDLLTRTTGTALSAGWPRLAGSLGALWPAVLLAALLPTLFIELSFLSMRKAPTLEAARITEALRSGLGLAFAFVFVFSTQYVMTARNTKFDLSYFRVARVSEATQRLAASFDEPVEVYLFFPPSSDAATVVEEYFSDLKAGAPLLSVTRLDHALEPQKAKELGVTGNGTVLIRKGGRKETLFIGNEVEKSKTQLRGLDVEVNKRLSQVGKARRTLYFTSGHGERSKTNADANDQRATLEALHRALTDQNFEVRPLTAAEGLGSEVPKDAAVVFIIGPQRAFDAAEVDSLAKYLDAGGKLFVALDPDASLDFAELLRPLGLTFVPEPLAQDRNVVNARPPPGLADRVNIATRTYSSHPIATYLGRAQSPVVFLGAGALEEAKQHPADLVVDFAVRSLTETWNDANRNFQYDEGETKKAWGVVAAVERKQAGKDGQQPFRAVVMGDSDAVADVVLANVQGNGLLVSDAFKWLAGDEKLAGPTNTEVDVPLTRTAQEDKLWFYGTTFFAPLLVVGLGFLASRRRSSKKGAQQ